MKTTDGKEIPYVCPFCHGKGSVMVPKSPEPFSATVNYTVCRPCNGSGVYPPLLQLASLTPF